MKKIVIALIFVLVLSLGRAYGLESEDVYLRRDVFEAKMDAFMSEIRLQFSEFRIENNNRFNALDKKIDGVKNELDKKIDGVQSRLDRKIDGVQSVLDKKIENVEKELHAETQRVINKIEVLGGQTDNTRTFVYWVLALFGIIGLFAPLLVEIVRIKIQPSFTIEDVKKLIEESKTRSLETQKAI